mgnify:CR=1 FL=1
MSEENNGVQPQGKQMGVAGFVLAIATLVLSSWIAAMAAASIIMGGSAWLMYVWLVLAIISVVLSAMGMSKLGKTGGKKGLAVAGLVIGIVSVVWCGILVAGLSVASSAADTFGDSDEWKDAMEQLDDLDLDQN